MIVHVCVRVCMHCGYCIIYASHLCYIFCATASEAFDALQICLCAFLQKKEEMPSSFKSIFEGNRVELKKKIKVTELLFHELQMRQILIQRNVDHIMVSS